MDVAILLLLKETLKHIIFNIINTYNFDTEYFYSVKRIHFQLTRVSKNYIKLSQRMYRVDRTDAWKLYSLSNYLYFYHQIHISDTYLSFCL